jgi:two-component system sensor histidine kinase KdpD
MAGSSHIDEGGPWVGRGARGTLVLAGALLLATGAVAFLEGVLGVTDASPVYLPAVVIAAAFYGTWPAVATSVLAFLAYDFLFTSPRFTLVVTDPAEWLSLLLFLLVAVVIGRLTALLRERAETADRRARESVSLVAISRAIAMAPSFEEAAAEVAERLRVDAEMESVTVRLGGQDPGTGAEIAVAGTAPDGAGIAAPWTLLRREADGSSDWIRIVRPSGLAMASAPASVPITGPEAVEEYLVPIEADGEEVGSILATRPADAPRPGRGARRILALAADQLVVAHRRDELRAELTASEIARQSDALRAAILDSVSHDLRTPIASIRALAGGLLDPAVEIEPAERRRTAAAIDEEAERLSDLVRSLLDMSRIQSGALHPDLEPYDLAELVETVVRRLDRSPIGRPVELMIPDDLPPVRVDAVLFDVAITNVIDNALRYVPAPGRIRVSAAVRIAVDAASWVTLKVDDDGPGVPPDSLERLFERFYRVPTTSEPARHGLGMGLAIARGFLEAMSATIEASRGDLGGLAISIGLPIAPPQPSRDVDR